MTYVLWPIPCRPPSAETRGQVQPGLGLCVQWGVDAAVAGCSWVSPAGWAKESWEATGESGGLFWIGVIAVPVYLECPHCDHPQVVPARRRGRALFCRQCGGAYKTSKKVDRVHPLPVSSIGELHSLKNPGRAVYILGA